MTRKRCPWCGKIIDKTKDKDPFPWQGGFSLLHCATCSHCRHNYGQFPVFPHLVKIDLLVVVLIALSVAFQSGILLAVTFVALLASLFLHLSMPYSKLNDNGKPCEENTDLYCETKILEQYDKIKRYELYFLTKDFDDFDPFVVTSPIHIYYISKKSNTLSGEFLYMHEKNYDFLGKDSCDLYDTDMNLIAKIKFISNEQN